MHTNKLVSITGGIIVGLFSASVLAEYYVVCTPPAVQYINIIATPICYKKSYKKPRRHKHHHVVKRVSPVPRSHAEISIHYIFDTSACSCDYSCTTCTRCSSCPESGDSYYSPTTYTLLPYDSGFSLDRRTGDDVGYELNIDY